LAIATIPGSYGSAGGIPDDSVKHDTVVETFSGQKDEVVHRLRSLLAQQFHREIPLAGSNHGPVRGIFLQHHGWSGLILLASTRFGHVATPFPDSLSTLRQHYLATVVDQDSLPHVTIVSEIIQRQQQTLTPCSRQEAHGDVRRPFARPSLHMRSFGNTAS
jgi:hypothetical protein